MIDTLRLYDTASRSVKPVTRPVDGALGMYCCGPTVYGPAHIGNLRTFVLQDVLRRVLEATGIPVKHVRNITDVDDKTIREATTSGTPLEEITRRWAERFRHDCALLGMLVPTIEPSAVDHIGDQIQLAGRLLDRGFAYERGGSLYFRIGSFAAYGALSRLEDREIRSGDANDADEYQRDSGADFVIWKALKAEDGPYAWPSPWGEGRPGWHLECSAMSMRYLGETIDLHCGGADLIFPHHENEIAQSEAATGKPFVRHWMHTAHLMVAGQKMSKSLGNLHTVSDVQARGFSPQDLRYVLLSGHYRQPLNFTWESLQAAKSAVVRLAAFHEALHGGAAESVAEDTGVPPMEWGTFAAVHAALLDDLNTPGALGELFRVVSQWNRDGRGPADAATLREWEVIRGMFGFEFALEPEIPGGIRELAEQRWAARSAKDWSTSDRLRDEILRLGWEMRDGKDGYTLKATN